MATCEHKYGAAYADPNQSSGYSRQCGLCGDIVEAAEGDGCDHIWVATENVGFSSGYGTVCTMCGELGEELDKPPTQCDHAGEEFERRVDATCEARGYDVYKCSLCNEILYKNIVEPLGHSWVAMEHDGFSSGYGYVCSRCGALGDELSDPDDGTGGGDSGGTGDGDDTGNTGGDDTGGTGSTTEDEDLLIRKSTLTSIADAIRAKTGEKDTMKPTEFADKITGISAGTSAEILEDVPIELDFSEGNQKITTPYGTLVKSAIIEMPETFTPANIAKGVTIAGVVGEHEGGGSESYDYMITVGGRFSISYVGSSPTVECPDFLEYYDDGGELVFTAQSTGTGTLRLYDSDTLTAEYTVKAADVGASMKYSSGTLSSSLGGSTTVTHGLGYVPDMILVYPSKNADMEYQTTIAAYAFSSAMHDALPDLYSILISGLGVNTTRIGFDKLTPADVGDKGFVRDVTKNTFVIGSDSYPFTVPPASHARWLAISGLVGGVVVGEQPQLNSPSLSRSGTTVTISNPSSNGGFVRSYKIYDGDTMISEQTGTSYNISGFGLGKHLLTAEAVGDKFITSARSETLNASKYSVSMTLSNVTANTSPTYAWHGDALTISLTPASGYALPSTITATMGGSSSGITYDADNKRIVINSVTGEVVISITAIKPVTLEETPWDKIADYAEDGSISSRFKLGDTKTLTATERRWNGDTKTDYEDITFTYTVELVGFDHDDLSSGDGKAGATFMIKTMYTAAENNWRGGTYGNDGCWQSAWMRTSLNDVTKNSLPAELSSRLKQVKKTCDLSTTSIETSDYLWIPSLQEVGGTTSESVRVHGTKYPSIALKASNSSYYITRNQPQTNNNEQYFKKQLRADGSVTSSSFKKCHVRWGFCL